MICIFFAAIAAVHSQGQEQSLSGNFSAIHCGDHIVSTTSDGLDELGSESLEKGFNFTATNRTLVTVGVCESDFSVTLQIYNRTSLSEVPIEFDDGCPTESEYVTTMLSGILEAGEYLIIVEGIDGMTGNFNLTLACEIMEVDRSQGSLSCGSTNFASTATGLDEVAGPGQEHVYLLLEHGHSAGSTALGSVLVIDTCFPTTEVNLNIFLYAPDSFSIPVAMSGPCPDFDVSLMAFIPVVYSSMSSPLM